MDKNERRIINKKTLTLLTVLLTVVFICGVAAVAFAVTSTGGVADNTKSEDEAEVVEDVKGTIYYVDAAAEKEDYDGTSPESPLKTLEQVKNLELVPGDAVLFKKDCRWVGDLQIKYSGTEDAPIIFGMYGKGSNKPCIDGAGIVNAPVWAEDISYVEICDLEVTNAGDDKNYHRGISILAVYENVEHVSIKNCYVHDVDSYTEDIEGLLPGEDKHWYGGIIVRARSNANPGAYDIILKDILIEGNEVDRCSLLGIAAGGAMDSWEEDKRCERITIRGNRVSNCWGDGIILFNDKDGLIEHNVAAHNGRSEDMTQAYAGIWNIWSDNCLIQYNESYGQGPSGDGQGFDIDGGCTGTVLQYNYSHDNAGGFLLCMQWRNGDATIRYNVSVNDGGSFLKIGYSISDDPLMRLNIYNNTYFTTKNVVSAIEWSENNFTDGIVRGHYYGSLRNNIFYVKNGENPQYGSRNALKLFQFENNCYQGFSEVSLPWDEVNQILDDPKFAFAGAAEKGMDSLSGYKLLAGSPCLDAGMKIYNDGNLDFWGNKISDAQVMNVGAYIGEAAKKPKGANLALAQNADISSFEGIVALKKSSVAKLLDGSSDSAVATKAQAEAEADEWFEVEMDDFYEINKVVLYASPDGGGYPVNFTICVCDESGEWVEVLEKKNCKQPKGESETYKFEKVSTNKIRIHVTKLRETENGYQASLSEIEIY